MKTRRVFFFLILLCSGLGYGFINDEDPLKTLLSKLDTYREKYTQEKIHIHTDKPYYAIGDTLWFKSYIVLAANNQLSNLSKIVYVELINEKDSVKKLLRLPVVAGLAWGDFTLSDSLSEGNYRVRAYTNLMRNFDESYFFDKTIKIGNSFSSEVVSKVSYNYSKTGIRENVEAEIIYTNLQGEPLKGKEVSYNVELDHRNILKGSGKTDSVGKVTIKFTNAQPFILKSGRINTAIKLTETVQVKKTLPIKATSADIDVQFFPESGNMVANVRSRVGFKAVGADGLGKAVSGYIIDNAGSKIVEFQSEYAGMGNFVFTPLMGKSYIAVVRFADGSEKRVDLPAHTEKGYVLSVSDSEDGNLAIKVTSAVNTDTPNEELIVVGQSNGIVHYTSRNKVANNVMSAVLPKKRFPSGIIQFTLFSSSLKSLAERLVFVRNAPGLLLNLSANKESYAPRAKVKLAIRSIDSAKRAVQGAFSLSVINETQVPFDDVNEMTIESNLLLSSELRGYIETPNYYFTDISSLKDRLLDNLMLTQGWRKFNWQDVIEGDFPNLVFEPENGLNIGGRVINANGTPAAGGSVSLLSATGTGLVLEQITNAEGRFRFTNLRFNDSTSFIIQARNSKGKKNVEILVDVTPRAIVTKNLNAANVEVNVNGSLLSYITVRKKQFDEMRKYGMFGKSIVLSEVKIVESKPKAKNSSNLNGAGNADAILTAADLKDCQSLAFCIHGRVAGLVIQNGIAYLARNMNSSFSGPVPMQLIIDGIFVEPSLLSIIHPNDVESIEVLKNGGTTAIYGMRGGGGVLIVTTKRGERNLSAARMAQGIASFTPQGLYNARSFYSPKYESPSSNASDWRTTIFWNPNLLTDSSGNASIEFYTADKPGTYKAVIEGLDLKGSLARKVYRFNVR